MAEELRSYGHIVVDEAQDLSPMQLRALARRSLSGSMTVVGDIAQATGPWAPGTWDEVMGYLCPDREPQKVELSVSYRTPAEVMELASGLLRLAAPELRPPVSVRRAGRPPRLVRATSAGLGEAVGIEAATLMDEIAGDAGPGTVAVLCPSSLIESLAVALGRAGIRATDPASEGLGAPLSLLPVDLANGLEFDAVVVVEPARIVSEYPEGLRALYVALTRPTRRLTLVHSEPLPPGMETPGMETPGMETPRPRSRQERR